MAQPTRKKKKKGPPFPWLLFLALIGSIYFFWFSPLHRQPKPIDIESGKSAVSRS